MRLRHVTHRHIHGRLHAIGMMPGMRKQLDAAAAVVAATAAVAVASGSCCLS
jgi:hypothetical protein